MKNDFNEENLVTFPSSKNFPFEEEMPKTQTIDQMDHNDPIEDLMAEIEQMELQYTSTTSTTTLNNDISFDEELDQDILNHRVFPRKKNLNPKIGKIPRDPDFIGKSTDLDTVINVMRKRVEELKTANLRTRFYLNEIKINQK